MLTNRKIWKPAAAVVFLGILIAVILFGWPKSETAGEEDVPEHRNPNVEGYVSDDSRGGRVPFLHTLKKTPETKNVSEDIEITVTNEARAKGNAFHLDITLDGYGAKTSSVAWELVASVRGSNRKEQGQRESGSSPSHVRRFSGAGPKQVLVTSLPDGYLTLQVRPVGAHEGYSNDILDVEMRDGAKKSGAIVLFAPARLSVKLLSDGVEDLVGQECTVTVTPSSSMQGYIKAHNEFIGRLREHEDMRTPWWAHSARSAYSRSCKIGGEVQFKNVPPGKGYIVDVLSDEASILEFIDPVSLRAGEDRVIRVQLKRHNMLYGRVLLDDGSAAKGAEVRLMYSNEEVPRSPVHSSQVKGNARANGHVQMYGVFTDDRGEFRIEGVRPSKAVLVDVRFSDNDRHLKTIRRMELLEGRDANLGDIVLKGLSVQLIIEMNDGSEVPEDLFVTMIPYEKESRTATLGALKADAVGGRGVIFGGLPDGYASVTVASRSQAVQTFQGTIEDIYEADGSYRIILQRKNPADAFSAEVSVYGYSEEGELLQDNAPVSISCTLGKEVDRKVRFGRGMSPQKIGNSIFLPWKVNLVKPTTVTAYITNLEYYGIGELSVSQSGKYKLTVPVQQPCAALTVDILEARSAVVEYYGSWDHIDADPDSPILRFEGIGQVDVLGLPTGQNLVLRVSSANRETRVVTTRIADRSDRPTLNVPLSKLTSR